jgi:hypothetical protein
MTNEDIIKLAMKYGFTGGFDAEGNLTYDATFVEAVTEAVKREREACWQIACEYTQLFQSHPCLAAADAIRARGEA